MKLSLIIDQIKTNAPTFESRVAGAAEYAGLREASNLVVPAAYVVPLDDAAELNRSQTGYQQRINDNFGVVCVVSNLVDERGQSATDALDTLRSELWAALLGWEPGVDYDRISYGGGALLALDRQRLDYQFEFNSQLSIDTTATWQGADIATSPAFSSIKIDLDHKEYPPDGVIDHTLTIPIETE